MLRFSTTQDHRDRRWSILVRLPARACRTCSRPSSATALARARCRAGCRPGSCRPAAIVLGLDLQGGSHVLLEVDRADLVRGRTARDPAARRRPARPARDARRLAGRHPGRAARRAAARRRRRRREPAPAEAARALAADHQPDPRPDRRPQHRRHRAAGRADPAHLHRRRASPSACAAAIEQAIEVLRRRVDALGTTEPNIQRQGADRILVQVPGPAGPAAPEGHPRPDREARVPHGRRDPGAADVDHAAVAGSPAARRMPVERRVIVEGEDLIDAQPGFDQRTSEPIVNFSFNIRGAQRFGAGDDGERRPPLAIVLDNEVISAPRILHADHRRLGPDLRAASRSQQANDLAVLLRAGALPAKLDHRRGAHRRPRPRRRLRSTPASSPRSSRPCSSSSSWSPPTASSASSRTSRCSSTSA